jgi:hypothetical protein
MSLPIGRRRKIYMALLLITSGLSTTMANQYDCVNCSGGASTYMPATIPNMANGLVFGNALATTLLTRNSYGTPISSTTGFYADPTRDYYMNANAFIAPAMVDANTYSSRMNVWYNNTSVFGGTPFSPAAPAVTYTAPTYYSVLPQ